MTIATLSKSKLETQVTTHPHLPLPAPRYIIIL